MKIESNECIGCGICVPYCPVEAIEMINNKAFINYDNCLECGTCGRTSIVKCPTKAIKETSDLYIRPRSIRKFFSDPATYHVETKVPGRGTEEVKTNDVTGRILKNEVGVGIELGRPCLGADFKEIEKITMSLAKIGIKFEECNPLYYLMQDKEKGTFPDDVKEAKVISAIIEFTIPLYRLEEVLGCIHRVSLEINTVFSLDLISRFDSTGTIIAKSILDNLGIAYRPNAKINLGLGKPKFEE